MAGAFADFFELQDDARRGTRRLIAAYILAALGVIACFAALAALPFWLFLGRVPAPVVYVTALAVGASILAVSAQRMWQLREGGVAVAELLGARRLAPGHCTAPERTLLNVVEEISIASGVAVPPVYCLDREDGINALAAGYSPHEAVLVVTQGALAKLTRDELQGMIAHEFSHVLNGDMALNIRLAAVTAGLMAFSSLGERLVYTAAHRARGASREARGAGALLAFGGAVMAFIGFPGAIAADAIRAAIAREREFLADAASVQFTRNPDAIAGALDAVLALRTHTAVGALHASELSHMFFAQAVSHWWGFATHPPIAERIRRVHPGFRREAYREGRGRAPAQREVAVLDGQGNVVKVVSRPGMAAAVGKPTRAELDVAVHLLAALPLALAARLADAQGASAVIFALALAPDEAARARELEALERRRGAAAAGAAARAHAEIARLSRELALPMVEIALPVLKAQPQAERDRLIADVTAVIEADRRVTLSELVLATFVRQHLREGAGGPVSARYRGVGEVAEDARVVLSLVAHAGGAEALAAYPQAATTLGVEAGEPLPLAGLTYARIGEALERLRHLAPLAKPRVLKACLECAAADGRFRIEEVELLRAVAATLDCPLPPLSGAAQGA